MSYLVIDTTSAQTDLFFDELVQLEGREYLMRFHWADRESCWYLNIYDQDENPLALTVRLVISWPLLRRFRDARLPPGVLQCVDMSDSALDILDPRELGERVKFMYITSDDPDLA